MRSTNTVVLLESAPEDVVVNYRKMRYSPNLCHKSAQGII